LTEEDVQRIFQILQGLKTYWLCLLIKKFNIGRNILILKGAEKMKRDNNVPPDFYIKNIAHVLRYKNDQNLVSYDITEPQARLLGHIDGAQRSEQEISRRYLSEAMQISGPSVTSLLNSLERNGFIVRRSGSDDGRTVFIELTEKTKVLLAKIPSVLNASTNDLLLGFSEQEKAIFLMLLKRAYDNLGIESHI
jgi:DNA-binding MarR family transcriptional regulator